VIIRNGHAAQKYHITKYDFTTDKNI
jgi:hypothetical protein